MSKVILNLEYEHLYMSYQIIEKTDKHGSDMFVIWIETGIAFGRYLKDGYKQKRYFDSLIDAMKALTEYIEEYEPQLA